MIGTNSVLVETEVLRSYANEVEESIDRLKIIFSNIESTVLNINSYWEGDGMEQCKVSYAKKESMIDISVNSLMKSVNDVLEMAGIYESAEQINLEEADALPSDLIV